MRRIEGTADYDREDGWSIVSDGECVSLGDLIREAKNKQVVLTVSTAAEAAAREDAIKTVCDSAEHDCEGCDELEGKCPHCDKIRAAVALLKGSR